VQKPGGRRMICLWNNKEVSCVCSRVSVHLVRSRETVVENEVRKIRERQNVKDFENPS
jgi:hypothetical protein